MWKHDPMNFAWTLLLDDPWMVGMSALTTSTCLLLYSPPVLITSEGYHMTLLEQNGYMQEMEAQRLMWAVEGVKLCDSFPWPQYSPHRIVPSPQNGIKVSYILLRTRQCLSDIIPITVQISTANSSKQGESTRQRNMRLEVLTAATIKILPKSRWSFGNCLTRLHVGRL